MDDAGHYEAIADTRIDDFEAETRRKLSIKDRTLKEPDCNGLHHGQPTPDCQYFIRSKLAGERKPIRAKPRMVAPDAA